MGRNDCFDCFKLKRQCDPCCTRWYQDFRDAMWWMEKIDAIEREKTP